MFQQMKYTLTLLKPTHTGNNIGGRYLSSSFPPRNTQRAITGKVSEDGLYQATVHSDCLDE